MKYTLKEKISAVEFSQLISEARRTVVSYNFKEFQEVISDYWEDIEQEPDFTEFDELQAADLYRWCGNFLCFYGKAKNRQNFQERAKNLLTKAIEIYSDYNLVTQKVETTITLATSYFYEGSINESEFILEQLKSEFEEEQLNPLYLVICINRMISMISKRQFQKVFEIVDEIGVAIEFCNDYVLCALYNEKAGIASRNTGQFEKAILHYNQGIYYAKKNENYYHLISFKNNLAIVYSHMADFQSAHQQLNEALAIAKENEFTLAYVIDSKATIYANEGFFDLALEIIEDAIKIYRQGESTEGLVESLWNKCKFLLALDRKEEAITLFGELMPIASRHMGDYAVKIFAKEFSDLIHIKQNGSLDEEVQRFKRVEIVSAIRAAKYNLTEAAEILKITLSSLTKTIDKEFPDLYKEMDILRLSDVTNSATSDKNNFSAPRNISELFLNDTDFIFESERPNNLKTFYFSSAKMFDAFGIEKDGVVAITPINKISTDDYVLVEDVEKNLYTFGKVNYDNILDIYFFESEDMPMPITFDEVKLIGKAEAYCPFDEIDNDKLVFRSLQTV